MTRRTVGLAAALLAGSIFVNHRADAAPAAYDVTGRSLVQIEDDLVHGRITAEALTRLYLDRIERLDRTGPALHSVLSVNPDAIAQAQDSDRRRKAHQARPLEGVPVLIKDNIETRDPLPTTAGSLALAQNRTGRDAPVVARLRAAGAVILGKTNLSEWANMRGENSISGWSALGGLTRNPYVLDRTACGSSSGSGAAIAASLAAAALGTETDGSVTCPANVNGLVGLKPTVGLVPRTHIVPISSSQDTAGPMTHSVADAARLLTLMAGSDPADPATKDADRHRVDYAASLSPDALKGKRIGVLRFAVPKNAPVDAVFAKALDTLRAQGATLVEIPNFGGPANALDTIGDAELTVLITELKATLDAYLASTPNSVPTRTLSDLIRFNQAHADRELGLFGQEHFEHAEATKGLDDPAYRSALITGRTLAGPDGIDRLLKADHLDALVAPTGGPAWVVDTVDGDHYGDGAGSLPAVAGYPHLTVPMGLIAGLPLGLSFIGPAWSEAPLLAMGYAFEQAHPVPRTPRFLPTLLHEAPTAALLEPLPH